MISPNSKSVDLSKLMTWCSAQWDDELEHDLGVSIETLDNPGWMLKVKLVGTNLAEVEMPELEEGSDDSSYPDTSPWIHCSIQNREFVGASDLSQLHRLISVFNALIDSVSQ